MTSSWSNPSLPVSPPSTSAKKTLNHPLNRVRSGGGDYLYWTSRAWRLKRQADPVCLLDSGRASLLLIAAFAFNNTQGMIPPGGCWGRDAQRKESCSLPTPRLCCGCSFLLIAKPEGVAFEVLACLAGKDPENSSKGWLWKLETVGFLFLELGECVFAYVCVLWLGREHAKKQSVTSK